jgi:signal transduction histidine kinase
MENFSDGIRYNLICSDDDSSIDVIAAYIAWLIDNNRKCYYYVDRDYRNELKSCLDSYCLDLDEIILSGKLVIDSALDFFINKRAYMEYSNFINLVELGLREGYAGVGIIADRDCFFESDFKEETLYEYEKSILNLLSSYPVSGLTCYNIDKFGIDTFFALNNLNPNFIYKRDYEIFVHNKNKSRYSAEEIIGTMSFFLKEHQRMKNENKVYQFVSNLSGDISYRKDEKEILEKALDNICRSTNIRYAMGVTIENRVINKESRTAYNMPQELRDANIRLFYENSMTDKNNFDSVKYITFDIDELDENIRQIYIKFGISYGMLIPFKYNNEIYGFYWLANHARHISYKSFLEHGEFLYKVCESIAKMIREHRKYKKMQESLIQSREMKVLGELAGGVAHEFNNLLTPILGYTQILKKKVNDPSLLRYISMIEESAKDGASIVNRIQEFSKNKNREKQLIDIDKVIFQSVEITKPKWSAESSISNRIISVDLELGSNGIVEGISTELREIFINIISNAVDAMPEGGKINIKSYNEDGQAVVKVRDNGTGMDKEVRERIFEPFFTTKNEKGNGLGLSIVFRIIKDMDGEIEVESQRGRGTEFTLRFPLKSGAAVENVDCVKFRAAAKRKIMVIEDHIEVAKMIGEMLQSIGHEVELCFGGEGIVEKFKSGGFDCVLCDLVLPEYSGIKLSEIMKSINPRIPFVLMSGWTGVVKDSELKYIDGVLQKPFSINELCDVLYEILGMDLDEQIG